jgi:hypothetical protein
VNCRSANKPDSHLYPEGILPWLTFNNSQLASLTGQANFPADYGSIWCLALCAPPPGECYPKPFRFVSQVRLYISIYFTQDPVPFRFLSQVSRNRVIPTTP